MNSIKHLIVLCALTLLVSSAFAGCAAHEKSKGYCGGVSGGKSCCHH